MNIQSCVTTLALAGVVVFWGWCLTAARFPEGGGIRIQGPGGINIDAWVGVDNYQKQEALPPDNSEEAYRTGK
jgi:hypothetical protein